MVAHFPLRELSTNAGAGGGLKKKKKNRLGKKVKLKLRAQAKVLAAGPLVSLAYRPKLITAPPYENVQLPSYSGDFYAVTRTIRFLRFCHHVDELNPTMVLDRPTMVGFWEHVTLGLYFTWKKSPRVAMMGSAEEWIETAHKQSRPTNKKAALRLANYWMKKLERVPELDMRNGPPMDYDVEKPRTKFRTKPGETVEQLKNAPRGRFNGQVYV